MPRQVLPVEGHATPGASWYSTVTHSLWALTNNSVHVIAFREQTLRKKTVWQMSWMINSDGLSSNSLSGSTSGEKTTQFTVWLREMA